MNTLRWICLYFVLAQAALILAIRIAWPIGQWRERRKLNGIKKAIAEVERLWRERSGG